MSAHGPDQTVCLSHCRLFHPRGPYFEADGLLCFRGERILATGEAARPLLHDARHIDCRGQALLPGFVDAHVHLAHTPEYRRRKHLLQGVTMLADLGAPLECIPVLRRERDAQGRATATALCAGPVFTAPGGYPTRRYGPAYALPVAGADQARRAVSLLHAYGARLLKLVFEPGDGELPVLDRDTARAAAIRAHELGMTARAHISGVTELELALDCGVDVVEHLPLRGARTPRGRALVEELFRRMADSGVLLVPTLDALSRSSWDNQPLLEMVALFRHSGGRLAVGTDAPFFGVPHGVARGEMRLLRQAGLTLEEVLQAATLHAALACGMEGNAGALEAGDWADMQLLAGFPEDFMELPAPLLVVKGGGIVREPGSFDVEDGIAEGGHQLGRG